MKFQNVANFKMLQISKKTNSTKVTEIDAQNLIEFSEVKFLIKFFSFENFEICNENYFDLRVLKIIENLNYITNYESYQDEPKR